MMPVFYNRAAVALSLTMPWAALLWKPGSAIVFYTLLALVLTMPVLCRQKSDGTKTADTPWLLMVCALTAPLLSSLLTDLHTYSALKGSEMEKSLRFALALPVLWLLNKIPVKTLRHVQWGLMAGACAGAGIIVISVWHGTGRDLTLYGATFNAVTLGDLTLLFGVLSVTTLPWTLSRFAREERLLKITVLIMSLAATWVSETRSSWMLLFVLLLVSPLLGNTTLKLRTRCAILLANVVVLAVALFVLWHTNPRFIEAMQDIQHFFNGGIKDTSLGIRLQLWQASLTIFSEHPWLGIGSHNFRDALGLMAQRGIVTPFVAAGWGEPHNDFVGALANYGIVGFAAILLLYGAPTWWFAQRVNSTDTNQKTAARLGLLLCLGYATFSVTESMFRDMRSVPLYSILVVVFVSLARGQKKTSAT